MAPFENPFRKLLMWLTPLLAIASASYAWHAERSIRRVRALMTVMENPAILHQPTSVNNRFPQPSLPAQQQPSPSLTRTIVPVTSSM
jgi:hypothetical protein